jgi:uncharacterized protein YkwD
MASTDADQIVMSTTTTDEDHTPHPMAITEEALVAQEADSATKPPIATHNLMSIAATQTLTADQSTALRIHNNARSAQHLNALHWDPSLAVAATNYAQHLAQINKLQHSSGSGQGENLYWTSTSDPNALKDGSQAWINERPNYHGEKIPEGNFGSYGHYSESNPRILFSCEGGRWMLT